MTTNDNNDKKNDKKDEKNSFKIQFLVLIKGSKEITYAISPAYLWHLSLRVFNTE